MATTCVVLPVFNEASVISRTLERVCAYAVDHPEIRFVFVDDGSSDDTYDLIRRGISAQSAPRVSCLRYDKNQGKGYAIGLGFSEALEDNLIFTDGDLAYALTHIPEIEKSLLDAEVVIGSRELQRYQARNSSRRRQFLGRAFNQLARLVAGLPYRDTQAGLKGFRREAAKRIFSKKRITGFGFDVEILFLAHKFAYRIKEIHAQVDGEHSYKNSKLKLLRDSLNMFGDLLRIRWYNLCGKYSG